MNSVVPRTWLITGASRGIGRAFAEAALEAGDLVAITARQIEATKHLVEENKFAIGITLDINDPDSVRTAIQQAIDHFGRLDVVVNNAGYCLTGAIEEVTEREVRDQMDTNFFGALRVSQAVLPQLRAQRSGHIVQVSSIGGVMIPRPMLGLYAASKSALEAMSECLALEVADFGVKVTIIEPSGFRTDAAGSSMVFAEPHKAYAETLGPVRRIYEGLHGAEHGDPKRAAAALLRIVSEEHPPLRLLLGNRAFDLATATYRQRLATWVAFEGLSRSADYPGPTVTADEEIPPR